MAAWSLVPILALATAGLSVESLSPDALCPPLPETRRAVDARLGQLELDGTWRATYVLVHRARGDFVSLQLFDPGGALRLERQLPVQASSCAALSEVVAVVLERFFLRPEEPSDAQSVPDLPSKPVETAPPPISATPEPAAPAPATEPPPPPPAKPHTVAKPRAATKPPAALPAATAHRFHAGAELWASTSWVAPSLRLERDLSDRYRLGLGAGFDLLEHRSSVFGGSALLRRVPLSLSASALWTLSSAVKARAGFQLLGVLELARTQSLADSGRGTRFVPGLGTGLGAELFPEASVQPFIQLTAAWFAGALAPAFQVGNEEVLKPADFAVGVSVGISTPF